MGPLGNKFAPERNGKARSARSPTPGVMPRYPTGNMTALAAFDHCFLPNAEHRPVRVTHDPATEMHQAPRGGEAAAEYIGQQEGDNLCANPDAADEAG